MNTTRFFLSQKVACVGVGCALLVMLAACDDPVSSDRGPVGRIVFQTSGLSPDIFVMNADGTGVVNLTNAPGADALSWRYSPWSPDGAKLAFMSDRDGNNDIFVMNADGTGVVNLTASPESDVLPSWSPDGTAVTFARFAEGTSEIYVVNIDGTGAVKLTDHPEYDDEPAWSPGAGKIAFLSNRGSRFGAFGLWIMNTDGTGVETLANSGHIQRFLWSPDGSRLLLHKEIAPGFDIFIMDADGMAPVNLTHNDYVDLLGAWSPDGSRIAFVSDRDGNSEIYVMNADGTRAVNLTNTPEHESRPFWSPRE